MADEDFVVIEQMAGGPLTIDELRPLGEAVDAAMQAFARPITVGPDVSTLAALTWAENFFLAKRMADYDALIGPILDQVVPHVPAAAGEPVLDGATVLAIAPLIQAAAAYREITDGLMNAAKGRTRARRTVAGRVVFFPAGDIRAEQRGKWFELRWREARSLAGADLLPDDAEEKVRRIDEHLAREGARIQGGSCALPAGPWYDEYCAVFVDGALAGQFAHVRDAEVWAGLPVADLRRALRPLWMRAARRLLVHLRARKWLAEIAERRPDALLTAIECVAPADLIAEIEAAGLGRQAAQRLIASMTRTETGERYPIPSCACQPPTVPKPRTE